MILGVILGGLVDTNIRRTLQIYGNRPFYQLLINRPIGTALIVIILLTFFFTIRKNIKFQRTFKK
jgi:TctA family transporter